MPTYVMYSPFSRIYKIGRSDYVGERLLSIRTDVPDLVLIREFVDDSLERKLHRYFTRACVGGEWFDLGKDGPERVDRAVEDLKAPEKEPRVLEPSEELEREVLRIIDSLDRMFDDGTKAAADDLSRIQDLVDDLLDRQD